MNQAVIEQDGMSRKPLATPTPDSLTGLLLPLSDRTLLLPNVAVAEQSPIATRRSPPACRSGTSARSPGATCACRCCPSKRLPAASGSRSSAAARGWW